MDAGLTRPGTRESLISTLPCMPSMFRLPVFFLIAIGLLSTAFVNAQPAEVPVYELRTYTTLPGKLDALLARFRDHTCKLFEKHGMVNVGYWVPLDAKDGAGEKLVYLLQYKSREAAVASWKAFGADPEWQAARTASEANGKIVAKVESVFLTPTDFSPPVGSVKSSQTPRVFEMRTYFAAEGKLPALNARFRDHTRTRFEQSGMTNVIYLHPLDADKGAGKTLVYFMAYPNRDAATKSWASFRADPLWVKAKGDSEKQGPLTTKTESVFLTPTDFSPLK
jgi:hypothetical protein